MTPIHSYAFRRANPNEAYFAIFNLHTKQIEYNVAQKTFKEERSAKRGCLKFAFFFVFLFLEGLDALDGDFSRNEIFGYRLKNQSTNEHLDLKPKKKRTYAILQDKRTIGDLKYAKRKPTSLQFLGENPTQAITFIATDDTQKYNIMSGETAIGDISLLENDPQNFVSTLKLNQEFSQPELTTMLIALTHWMQGKI